MNVFKIQLYSKNTSKNKKKTNNNYLEQNE